MTELAGLTKLVKESLSKLGNIETELKDFRNDLMSVKEDVSVVDKRSKDNEVKIASHDDEMKEMRSQMREIRRRAGRRYVYVYSPPLCLFFLFLQNFGDIWKGSARL